MTFYVAPRDDEACGNARMRWPARPLIAQGADVRILEPRERYVFGTLAGASTGEVVQAMAPDDCELVVFQRPTSAPLVRSIPFLRAKGIAVVVDIDDDLSTISARSFAFNVHHPKRDPTNHWRWAEQACKDATMVTVSTPALAAKYGAHGRVRVLRNCVPDHYLDVEPSEKWDGFGWPGNVHTHPDDLDVLGPTAAKLTRAGFPFRVVGPSPELVGRALGLDAAPEGTGSIHFDDWPAMMARLSVAIAPIADTRFNAAKSNYKILECLGLGIPWVASGSDEYRRLAHLGAIATRPREWMRELGRLLNDANLRQERAEQGREAAKALTYSRRCDEWMSAWADALTIQRATVAV